MPLSLLNVTDNTVQYRVCPSFTPNYCALSGGKAGSFPFVVEQTLTVLNSKFL